MMKIFALSALTAVALAGCSTPNQALANFGENSALPDAIVYKMSGDYQDYVPVTLNEARTEVVSWPAPSDITDQSTPLRMADGYWLDRRGITATSAFTRFTYDDYRHLKATPSRAELLDSIIPGAVVTEIRRLPIKLWQAVEDPVMASKLINSAPVIYQAPVLDLQ